MHITHDVGRRHVFTRGERLRAAREHMDGSPSQEEFARMLGVSRATVKRYEADRPGSDRPIVLMRWAEVTGYSLAWICADDGPRGGVQLINLDTRRYPVSELGRFAA